MAEQDTKPDVSISKGLRRLKGDWLEEAGFKTDTPVEVRVLPGCLTLTAHEPQQET